MKPQNELLLSPLTSAEEWQQQAKFQMTEICLLLNWSLEEYCQLQYECGRAYLYWYLPCDKHARSRLEGSKLYWNWWKHFWCKQDEAFLTFKLSILEESILSLQAIYTDLYNPRTLVIDTKPDAVVLAELNKKEVVV